MVHFVRAKLFCCLAIEPPFLHSSLNNSIVAERWFLWYNLCRAQSTSGWVSALPLAEPTEVCAIKQDNRYEQKNYKQALYRCKRMLRCNRHPLLVPFHLHRGQEQCLSFHCSGKHRAVQFAECHPCAGEQEESIVDALAMQRNITGGTL